MRSTFLPILTQASQKYAIVRAILIYFVGIICLALIAFQPFVEIPVLTRDPLAITDGEFYFGLLSNIGIMFWCAAAIICLFTYFLLRAVNPGLSQHFFLYAGLLTLFLLVDDLFMVHESVFPLYLRINEKVVMAMYLLFMGFLLVRYRYKILSTPYLVLMSSLGFLGLSMIVDTALSNLPNYQYLLEDGLKFLGIMGWLYYFTQTCYSTLIFSFNRSQLIQSQTSIIELDPRAETWPDQLGKGKKSLNQ